MSIIGVGAASLNVTPVKVDLIPKNPMTGTPYAYAYTKGVPDLYTKITVTRGSGNTK